MSDQSCENIRDDRLLRQGIIISKPENLTDPGKCARKLVAVAWFL